MGSWPENLLLPTLPVVSPFSLAGLGGVAFFGSGSPAVWPTANLAIYVPFRITRLFVVRRLFLVNGAAVSGNFDVGVYDAAFRRLVSSGSVVQSGANAIQTVTVAETVLGPGQFYLALVFDNATGGVLRIALETQYCRAFGMAEQAAAFPLPTMATPATSATAYLPFFGASERTVV